LGNHPFVPFTFGDAWNIIPINVIQQTLEKENRMAHAENKLSINRSVSQVFNFVLDGTNNPHWRPACVDIQRLSNQPDGVGSKFKQGLKGPGGRRIDGDYEIVKCEPNKLIEFQVIAGPARPTGSYKFEATGDVTNVTFVLHYDAKGLQKLMEPMINQQMQVEVAMLSNLKSYLEGPH
jgi:uncharacterized membrane protein